MTITTKALEKNAFEFRIKFAHRARRHRYEDARQAMDVRDDLVAWVQRKKRDGTPANAFELHHRHDAHAGYLYETEDGWVLNIVISYRTPTGDGDRFDVKRGIQRVLDQHRAGEIVHVRRKRVKV